MLNLLKKHFGYDEYRPGQEEIVRTVLRGEDAFVLMPTGGGKSLCYQLPALALDGVTLVVSPLIALMKDQVDGLRENGIAAEFLNSTLEAGEKRDIEERVIKGLVKILYVAPERLMLSGFRDFLRQLPVKLIAIDEAHCISEWGHDFRPEYRNLKNLRREFAKTPVIALTATATERVRRDIVTELRLENAKVFLTSFNRPNLRYYIEQKQDTFSRLVLLLKKYQQKATIIYCFSRKDTERVAEDLREQGFAAVAYHAGLQPERRKKVQEDFIRDEVSIIVATIAFGMGIDKPDVRLVVHYDLPKTIEGYYQETGRAGRDGLPSDCVLFYSYGDVRKHKYFSDQITDEKERVQAEEKLRQMITLAELTSCRRKYLLEYFGEKTALENCGGCDMCLSPQEEFDATVVVQKILSAVLRTGERFGTKYIVDVLHGAKNKSVRDRGHEELSVFGIARDFSADELAHLVRILVTKDILKKDDGEYPTLSVTARGRNWLRDRETLALRKFIAREEDKKESKNNNVEEVGEFNTGLFEKLRVLRKKIADEKHVPPFMIFGDASLREMCQYFPQSLASFLCITGVGQEKLSRFGEMFIKIIKLYAEEQNLPDTTPVRTKKNRRVR